jgi:uncharacterized protein
VIRIAVTGAGGFIGKRLCLFLEELKFEVVRISRRDFEGERLNEIIRSCEGVINLAGESIGGIWTQRKREAIYNSRILTTRKLVQAINQFGTKMSVFVQVSAVGIYDKVHVHDEESTLFDDGFLSKVVIDWEGELKELVKENLRICILRLGIVLDENGGVLKMLEKPFRMGFSIGISSDEDFPFIHMIDLLEIFKETINNPGLSGVINAVAPERVSIRKFFRLLSEKSSKRVLWVQPKVLKFMMGESAGLITSGQRVIPGRLQKLNFQFLCKDADTALSVTVNS